jgi:hypothetical protein
MDLTYFLNNHSQFYVFATSSTTYTFVIYVTFFYATSIGFIAGNSKTY